MSALELSPVEFAAARRVCTAKQLRVVDLRRRGWSYRRCGEFLGIDERTVRDHMRRAERRIIDELERQTEPVI